MERNYRERNRYYRDDYNDYPRNKDKFKNRNYKLEDDYRGRNRNRDSYNYRDRERSRDDKYKDREKNIYGRNYYDKYKDDYYDKRKDDKYDDYRKYSRSQSYSKEKDYYRDRDNVINLLEGDKRIPNKYRYRKKDSYRRKRNSSSSSTIKNEKLKEEKENEKGKEKEPFVSAFTNFPFPLPEVITKNENYHTLSKLYNDNDNNNLNLNANNATNNPDTNKQNNVFTNNPNSNTPARPSILNDTQFSLYTNPYLVQSLALLPTAQNTDKKLYIGNLPNGMTPPSLIKMLNIALLTLKPEDFSPGEPVINAWVSPDGHYAFVEFRTAEEATKGFILNGFKFLDLPLKVGRPKTYQGLPQNAEDVGPSNTVAAILLKSKKSVPVKTYKYVMPTKVLCLNSIIKGLDIEDEDKYQEVVDDIKGECEKYGNVLDVFLPRKDVEDNETPGMGNAYVMYESVEQSKLARRFLSLKRFNNQLIYIQYIPEENFINKKFDPII
jgi:hypothetical protein